jgi:hypothetical protein
VRQYLTPIEHLRNAVAHNRAPSRTVAENYDKARDSLTDAIERFMAERPPEVSFGS